MWKGPEIGCVQGTGREGRKWKGKRREIRGPFVEGILGLVMTWNGKSLAGSE